MDDILICQDTWDGSSKVVYTVVSSTAQFFAPVVLVIILYLSIYLKLRNRPQVSFMLHVATPKSSLNAIFHHPGILLLV